MNKFRIRVIRCNIMKEPEEYFMESFGELCKFLLIIGSDFADELNRNDVYVEVAEEVTEYKIMYTGV